MVFTDLLIYQKFFHQNAFENTRREEGKLRKYAIFKTEIGIGKYQIEIKHEEMRKQMTEISDHCLVKDIPEDKPLLPISPLQVETEIHFLLSCPPTKGPGCELSYFLIDNAFFKFYSIKEKFRHLMASNTNTYHLGAYVSKCFELRTTVISDFNRSEL